jgi:hypothetical protein
MSRTPVTFTPRQIEFINSMFPEITGSINSSDNELRWRAAQRSVVAVLKEHVSQENQHELAR